MECKAFLSIVLFLAFACSPSYQQRGGGGFQRPGPEPSYPPRPFRFSYNNQLDPAGTSYHESEGDGAGRVSGTYGYNDPDGVFRVVQYVADAAGYRANIRTNEPGTEAKNPADVVLDVQPVPQAVLSRYALAG